MKLLTRITSLVRDALRRTDVDEHLTEVWRALPQETRDDITDAARKAGRSLLTQLEHTIRRSPRLLRDILDVTEAFQAVRTLDRLTHLL